MNLYPFQERAYDLLSVGRSVILQAPTGSGKTAAALYPFLRSWEEESDFPRKCIYSVPLRVLANQFWEEYEERGKKYGFHRPMAVQIQTGECPYDRKLEGNLIFTTVDQTLSNFLNIPYALSSGQANLNAGAVLGSYLVFDELHLFDPEVMLPTVLHLLRMLQGIVPFLAMTATLSDETVRGLAGQLGAEPIVLPAEEANAIPSQRKTRRLHVVEDELTASAIMARHRERSIAICNTVGRAQALFVDLCEVAESGTEVRLLHSRFLQEDRAASEIWLRREFGKNRDEHTVESAILVATQVVEVGLDITSQVLHSELAPAASVIQRAGRCARYEREVGDVYVYRLPAKSSGELNYAPYFKEQKEICERTWTALLARSGDVFDFATELVVVDEAHSEVDQRILARLQANRHYLVDRVAETIEAQEREAAAELIRHVDNRTVIVHPDPRSVENPWTYEGFGIHRNTLFGAYDVVQELAGTLDEDWVLMTAVAMQEEESSRAPSIWTWLDVAGKEDLEGALFVAVNPRLARYSTDTGFQLGAEGEASWRSPRREWGRRRKDFAPYQRETFQEHVNRMLRVYEYPFYDWEGDRQRLALKEELVYAARRLEERHGWAQGTLDRLARVVIVLHDLGKLDKRWQEWAHFWQKEVGRLRGEDLAIPPDYMAAHTDYDQRNEGEEALNRKLSSMRPNHAVESAKAALDCIWSQMNDEALTRAALTAIARHHSAGARGDYGAFSAHAGAQAALNQVFDDVDATQAKWAFPEGTMRQNLMRPQRRSELVVYLLLVRMLRLADQRSQQLSRWE
jgi:CRISPR-associated endonuclease/helicase Cas3